MAINKIKVGDTEHDVVDSGAYRKTGGDISGHVYLTGSKETSSTANTTQIVFGTSTNNHVSISSNTNAIVINPNTTQTTNQIVLYLDKSSQFPSGITGNLTGTASKATGDGSGNNIINTYATKTELTNKFNGVTISYDSGTDTVTFTHTPI